MLHRGIEPASAACRSDALPTELHPISRCVQHRKLRLPHANYYPGVIYTYFHKERGAFHTSSTAVIQAETSQILSVRTVYKCQPLRLCSQHVTNGNSCQPLRLCSQRVTNGNSCQPLRLCSQRVTSGNSCQPLRV